MEVESVRPPVYVAAMATATVPAGQSVSRWLEPGLVCVVALVSTYVIPVAVGTQRPVQSTGNVLQVLGACWAALGVPVASEGLAWLERVINRWRVTVGVWAARRRAALKTWWDRRRGRIHATVRAGAAIVSGGSVSGKAHVTSIDRATLTELARIELLEQDVKVRGERLAAIERKQAQDTERWNRELAAQAQELRAHTIAVTRRGWEFILGGLVCSGVGAFLALIA